MAEPGILSSPFGGLGNQLFNVCASWVISQKKGVPLYILTAENNKHNKKSRNYTTLLFQHFGKAFDFTIQSPELVYYVKPHMAIFALPSSFTPWTPDMVPSHTLMCSYYQYYPPLKEYEQQLRSILLKSFEPFRSKFTRSYSRSAFLHIRRGDYLEHSDIHFVQPLEYYTRAINILLGQTTIHSIIVVSDDPIWVKTQPLFKSQLFELYTSDDEIETLALMTLCEAGAICANSTFSWWGAFLGAYGKRNPVIIPRNWINEPCKDLFPEEWIVI